MMMMMMIVGEFGFGCGCLGFAHWLRLEFPVYTTLLPEKRGMPKTQSWGCKSFALDTVPEGLGF